MKGFVYLQMQKEVQIVSLQGELLTKIQTDENIQSVSVSQYMYVQTSNLSVYSVTGQYMKQFQLKSQQKVISIQANENCFTLYYESGDIQCLLNKNSDVLRQLQMRKCFICCVSEGVDGVAVGGVNGVYWVELE